MKKDISTLGDSGLGRRTKVFDSQGSREAGWMKQSELSKQHGEDSGLSGRSHIL